MFMFNIVNHYQIRVFLSMCKSYDMLDKIKVPKKCNLILNECDDHD
ncbi:hypothetical protein PL9214490205 [Planktothrix tepida PCC 9214]|uniref:Uncharacterized protein n=1 Tax=Planktothrix tepida PCC 9214 TaxID=671072 RepID=A0A1J1LKW5_9CYAN|nr:hypothetical protein PL9214490205 [Planktothrix tepida PCC 9214]